MQWSNAKSLPRVFAGQVAANGFADPPWEKWAGSIPKPRAHLPVTSLNSMDRNLMASLLRYRAHPKGGFTLSLRGGAMWGIRWGESGHPNPNDSLRKFFEVMTALVIRHGVLDWRTRFVTWKIPRICPYDLNLRSWEEELEEPPAILEDGGDPVMMDEDDEGGQGVVVEVESNTVDGFVVDWEDSLTSHVLEVAGDDQFQFDGLDDETLNAAFSLFETNRQPRQTTLPFAPVRATPDVSAARQPASSSSSENADGPIWQRRWMPVSLLCNSFTVDGLKSSLLDFTCACQVHEFIQLARP